MKRFAIAIALVATLVVGGSLGASNAQAGHPHHHHHHHHGGYGGNGGYGGYGGHYHYHSNFRPYGYSVYRYQNPGCTPGYGYGGGRSFSLYFGGY